MLGNIKLCRYDVPTPIQAYCIPSVLQGQDVIAIAQTGKYLNCEHEQIANASCYRLWKDRCISDSDHIEVNGKGQAVGCTSSWSLQRIRRVYAWSRCWTFGTCRCSHPRIGYTNLRWSASSLLPVHAASVCRIWRCSSWWPDGWTETWMRYTHRYPRPNNRFHGPQQATHHASCSVCQPFFQLFYWTNTLRFTVIDEADEMVSPDWESDMQTLIGGGGTVPVFVLMSMLCWPIFRSHQRCGPCLHDVLSDISKRSEASSQAIHVRRSYSYSRWTGRQLSYEHHPARKKALISPRRMLITNHSIRWNTSRIEINAIGYGISCCPCPLPVPSYSWTARRAQIYWMTSYSIGDCHPHRSTRIACSANEKTRCKCNTKMKQKLVKLIVLQPRV